MVFLYDAYKKTFKVSYPFQYSLFYCALPPPSPFNPPILVFPIIPFHSFPFLGRPLVTY